MKISRFSSAALLLLSSLLLVGCPATEGGASRSSYQQTPPKTLLFEDHVYEEHIRTVQLYRGDNPTSYPFLYLKEPTQLSLEFDALIPPDANPESYWVSVVSCDHEWQPSTLLPLEFLEGISTDRIFDFERSQNTMVPYVHYRYRFPAEGSFFKRSGNYLLKVYAAGNENKLLLTRRFIVADPKVEVEPLEGQSRLATDRRKIQRVDFRIKMTGNLPGMFDPRQDFKVYLLQNFRWDNALSGLQPLYLTERNLEYQIDAGREFEGGNEYRWMDIRSTRFMPHMVRKIELVDSVFHIDLWTDTSRVRNRYRSLPDQNGGFFIDVQENPNPDWESDYVYVRFGMQADAPMKDASMHVYGRFNDWKCTPENELLYNPARSRYEGEILMKQGVYDYAYAVQSAHGGPPRESLTEGSHSQTENFYTILVYFQPMGARNSELIGISHINYIYR